MKTTYKVKRGHVWHVVHETKTTHARTHGTAWTLCGSYYDEGQAADKTPTCPGCLKQDNPLTMSGASIGHFKALVRGEPPPNGRLGLEELVRRDYVDHEATLTRRGKLLALDILQSPVPMADAMGLVHARKPLSIYPACERNGRLLFVDQMTTERYAKLRMVSDQIMVTCLQCLAR